MMLVNRANKYKHKGFIMLMIFFIIQLIFSCNDSNTSKKVDRAFYFWKSVLQLSDFEKMRLDSLQVKTIYIKFFDVDWNEAGNQPVPVAKLQARNYKQPATIEIIPVIFITNECIKKMETAQLSILANNISKLIQESLTTYNFNPIKEIQIDCDWTATTKEKYFELLQNLKQQNSDLFLSATIRLHQVKYISKTGVPPVDKGLLMCYNMGNLKNPATTNSIIDKDELMKYISNLNNYSLPLDIALPLFDWKVLFRNNVYTGIIENLPDTVFSNTFCYKQDNRYIILTDTLLNGYPLKKGDVLRNEQSDYNEIITVAKNINNRLKNTHPRVSLYHLDSVILNKYTLHELETIYNSIH